MVSARCLYCLSTQTRPAASRATIRISMSFPFDFSIAPVTKSSAQAAPPGTTRTTPHCPVDCRVFRRWIGT